MPTAQDAGAPCEEQSQNIAEIVPGIRQQCQRIGEQPKDDFNDNKCQVQPDANRKGAVIVEFPMVMAMSMMMPVSMCMMGIMGITSPVSVLVIMRHWGDRLK